MIRYARDIQDDTDWNAWCQKHHIKIKGSDRHEDRPDAGRNHKRIFRTLMATESDGNAGQAGNRDI